nr:hypothetical protein CFP56_35686 [Quercus suber]
MVRIYGPQLDSHLCSLQYREGHLGSPRRREQGNPMNQERVIAKGWVLPKASGGGPNSRSSRLKQTTNRVHASGVSGASGGVAINEPNPPRIPPTKQAGSSAATTKQATSYKQCTPQ